MKQSYFCITLLTPKVSILFGFYKSCLIGNDEIKKKGAALSFEEFQIRTKGRKKKAESAEFMRTLRKGLAGFAWKTYLILLIRPQSSFQPLPVSHSCRRSWPAMKMAYSDAFSILQFARCACV